MENSQQNLERGERKKLRREQKQRERERVAVQHARKKLIQRAVLWGEQFTSECILDACNGEEGTVTMRVNGEENFEFENYMMQEGDLIEIVYE